MMGRVSNRRRASLETMLHGEFEGVRNELTTTFEELRREIVTEHEVVEARAAQQEAELFAALHRIAGAFEKIAEGLETDRRDRRHQLDAVEFLLREMVLGFAPPTATPPVVVGGSIEPDALAARSLGRVDIDLSDTPIAVGTAVEVRSRFHDRWVHGFAVAEYVVGPERRGYRLRRMAEPDQLPLLFEEADVRSATLTSDLPLPTPADDPNHSIWR
jgi:hypothetical protein